jgi:serine/threonine protein kinase
MFRANQVSGSMTNDAENWEQLQVLFHLVEMTPEEDRERVLTEQCADVALRQRVLAILKASDVENASAPKLKPIQSGQIGHYSLIRHLGSGGLGSVYLVERMVGGTAQRAALKVLAPHAVGASFIERFYREEEILASLDHPNITHMFDAGLTETGQPYLVMEYVDGIHLDVYCDQRKLTITERLELFLQVCDAVAYAHRNLVIHLDLKPSNILVSTEGTVKLLDFGTSKIIQSDSLLTTTVLATPAYASPEQLRNEAVTTASDIYALGAILFELLAGRRPGGKASVAVMIERAMREQPPERVTQAVTAESAELRGVSESGLCQVLSGDLTTIVGKCLSPRPGDRYPALDMLAEDLRRYLDGRPVLVRPQTILYRTGKFVRRNRRSVAAAVVVSLLLVGSLGYALWRQQQALREAQRAERMQTFMHQLFRLANSNYTGKPAVTVPEFLQLGVKILPDYIRNPGDLLQAKVALAESMFDNGDLNDAETIFQQTAATARSMADVDAEAESEAFVGHIRFLHGDVASGKKITADALRLSRQKKVSSTVRVWAEDFYAYDRENLGMITDENIDLLRSAADEATRNYLPVHERAKAIYNLGTTLEYLGKLDEAAALYDEALSLYKQDPEDVCDPSAVYGDLAYLHYLKNDVLGSLPFFQRSYDGYKTCSGAGSRDALSILAYMGAALVRSGRTQDAINLLEASWPEWEKVSGGYISLPEYPVYLSIAYVAAGRYPDAEKLASALLAARQVKISSGVADFPEFILAQALAGEHRYQEALPHADLALHSFRETNPNITVAPWGYTIRAQVEDADADIRSHLGLPKMP